MDLKIIVPIVLIASAIVFTIYMLRNKLPFVVPSNQYIQHDGKFFKICRLTGLLLFLAYCILAFGFNFDFDLLKPVLLVTQLFIFIGLASKRVKTNEEKKSTE